MHRRIVTTTAVFEPGYPADRAIHRLARLGFDGLDMALDYCTGSGSPFLSHDYINWAQGLRREAALAGVRYTHAHAPGEAENNPHIERSIRAAAALGAKYMVLHPVWRVNDRIIEDESEFIARNAQAISPWLPVAMDEDMTILSENLLWGASTDPRIIARLVAAVGSPHFGWCYDTGHAHLHGHSPAVLTQCACAPLSLHLQDNHAAGADEHLIPGDGTINWNECTCALKAAHYAGDVVLEAHHQSLDAPDGERDAILTRLLQTAKALRDQLSPQTRDGTDKVIPRNYHNQR